MESRILTPNKLLTRFPVLIKAGNNSYKLKNEINQVIIIMAVNFDNNKLLIITESKTIHFDLP